MTEVSLVTVTMEELLLSHRRVVWLHDKEVAVPKCISVAAHRPCLPSVSILEVLWALCQSSHILGYFADGILILSLIHI